MRKLFIMTICVIAFASCTTQKSLYSWYGSEDATYKYTKRGTDATIDAEKLTDYYIEEIK